MKDRAYFRLKLVLALWFWAWVAVAWYTREWWWLIVGIPPYFIAVDSRDFGRFFRRVEKLERRWWE